MLPLVAGYGTNQLKVQMGTIHLFMDLLDSHISYSSLEL